MGTFGIENTFRAQPTIVSNMEKELQKGGGVAHERNNIVTWFRERLFSPLTNDTLDLGFAT